MIEHDDDRKLRERFKDVTSLEVSSEDASFSPLMAPGEMLAAYLQHLGVDAGGGPTLALLRQLQRAHVQTIPYENLDVLAGSVISA